MSQVSANLIGTTDAILIGNGRPGLSSANLRGLGEGSTLVLLNGWRNRHFATTGSTVNLNFIPVAAIGLQRPAAFRIRSRHRARGRRPAASDADRGDGDLTNDRLNVFITVNYPNNDALPARDRSFSRTAYRPDEYIENGRERDATPFPLGPATDDVRSRAARSDAGPRDVVVREPARRRVDRARARRRRPLASWRAPVGRVAARRCAGARRRRAAVLRRFAGRAATCLIRARSRFPKRTSHWRGTCAAILTSIPTVWSAAPRSPSG